MAFFVRERDRPHLTSMSNGNGGLGGRTEWSEGGQV